MKQGNGMSKSTSEFWDQSNFNYPESVHVRIHPLLGWTELDIWKYIKRSKDTSC